jgi:hypothetical protein
VERTEMINLEVDATMAKDISEIVSGRGLNVSA